MLELEKENKPGKKSYEVERTLYGKLQKLFSCKLDLKKRVKNEQFFPSDCEGHIPYSTGEYM